MLVKDSANGAVRVINGDGQHGVPDGMDQEEALARRFLRMARRFLTLSFRFLVARESVRGHTTCASRGRKRR